MIHDDPTRSHCPACGYTGLEPLAIDCDACGCIVVETGKDEPQRDPCPACGNPGLEAQAIECDACGFFLVEMTQEEWEDMTRSEGDAWPN